MNKTKEQNIVLSAKLAFLALAIFAIALAFIIFFAINLKWQTTNNNDISGWCSLIVGSAIGIYITFAILIYSDYSQKNISDIIIKQNERDEKRKNYVTEQLRHDLYWCGQFMPTRIQWENYTEEEFIQDQKDAALNYFDSLYYLNESLIDLRTTVNLYADVLEPEDVTNVIELADYTRHLPRNLDSLDKIDIKILNLSSSFHERLDILTKKFPKPDDSSG